MYHVMLDKLKNDLRGQFGVKQMGSALMVFALIIVVLNQLFTLDIVDNTNGPFSIDQVTSIGGAAIAIGVLGILVFAATIAMRFMDQF